MRRFSDRVVRAYRLGGRAAILLWLVVGTPLVATFAPDAAAILVSNVVAVALLLALELQWRVLSTARPTPEVHAWERATRLGVPAALLAVAAVGVLAGMGVASVEALDLGAQGANLLVLVAGVALARAAALPQDGAAIRRGRVAILAVALAYAPIPLLAALASGSVARGGVGAIMLAALGVLAATLKPLPPDACRECGAPQGRAGAFCPACGANAA